MPRRHLGVRAQSRAGSRRRHQIFMNGSSYRPNERCGRVITPKATSTRYNSHTARTWGKISEHPRELRGVDRLRAHVRTTVTVGDAR
jgi:hypothetical protein